MVDVTPEQIAVVGDATKRGARCDLCFHWKPLSSARVMGWCEVEKPMPNVRPVMLLLGRLDDDRTTAYNQVCNAFRKILETGDEHK